MKERIIKEIIPYFFEDYLLIGLSKKWINIFDNEIPKFDVFINNEGRLILQSQKIGKQRTLDEY